MESLSTWEREKALKATIFLSMRQLQGVEPEEQGAQELGFGSVEVMRAQLRNWGAPTWMTQDKQATEKPKAPKPAPHEGKARASGPVEQLPPASNAIPLFREALETLVRGNEDLKHRKETRQGKHYPYRTVSPKTPSDEEWEYYADLLGLDPVARANLRLGGGAVNRGTSSRAPLSPLPELIGAYLLAGCEVEPLVEALHPSPSSADWSEIRRYIEGRKGGARQKDGIKTMALRLAILIRGGTLKKGQPPPGESGHNLNLSHRITVKRKEGVPDKQIYQELLVELGLSDEELPWDEFRRLAALGLELP
jgi:hypothetical protein